MELTPEQRQAVTEWLKEGATLSDVQRNLKEAFDLTLTYMDVRLMVLDIGATVQDKVEPPPKQPDKPQTEDYDPDQAQTMYDDEDETPAYDLDEDGVPLSTLKLTLDRLVVPGAIVSGDVTFSDGVVARWLIDEMGRFGLEPSTPGYRPTDADLQELQFQLRTELKRHGYG